MSWTTFHCDDPDFVVRSIPANVQYDVRRSCLLTGSEVFRDMFSCCSPSEDSPGAELDQTLDLQETGEVLAMLLCLLHTPPGYPSPADALHVDQHLIPLPLLPTLFDIADKYALSEEIVGPLQAHLRAHSPHQPLQVYGYATERAWHDIAADASEYLLHPPLSSYSIAAIRTIPTVEAYHKLVLLHHLRTKQLRALVLTEEIFPYGYGSCPSHSHRTAELWALTRDALAPKIEAGTDVAAEMASVARALEDCQTCNKACSAAIDMLAYKCRKIPSRVDELDSSTTLFEIRRDLLL